MAVPKSLFDICLVFVSSNIQAVENFDGFPEIVGEKVFKCFVNLSTSMMPVNSIRLSKNIHAFEYTYKDLVLKSVNLTDSLLIINEYLECFVEFFQNISEVCLCSCFLGDSHEFLEHFNEFTLLKKLCLKNNCLSDKAIRKMILPIKMFNKGAKNIEYLDLSENKFSDEMTPWLSWFDNLKYLEISKSNLSGNGIKMLRVRCSLSVEMCESEMHPIKDEGWATTLIKKWKDDYEARKKKREIKKHSYFAERKITTIRENFSIYPIKTACSKNLIFKKSLHPKLKKENKETPPSDSLKKFNARPFPGSPKEMEDLFQQYR